MRKFFWYMKGATAYEAQLGPCVIRFVHLSGAYWKHQPWRRVSFQWDKDWKE